MLDAIRVFLAVVNTRSLSKVAKDEGIAVSSVSRKIDALETELGFKLFHRTSRLVMLTDSGEQFLPRAKNILLELEEAKNAMSALSADPKGLLTVTAPASFGRLYVAPAVTTFLKRYPLMEIELNISDEIIDLSAHRIDVAVRIGTLPDSDLVATRLAPFKRLVCASPDYIARHGRPQTPEDLLQHNCLSAATNRTVAGLWCFPNVNKGAPLAVHGNFRSNDTHSLLLAAVNGIGVVHLADWLLSDMIVSGQLISLFPETATEFSKNNAAKSSAKIEPGIYAVRMPGRSHAAKAQLFIDHLRSEFGEPAFWEKAISAIST
ncbi:LysR family transcriptional regulator [Cellvibrio zantedeschiae]|uniref:LysR family transcriptional regulator n=1 Tax=Cellvibrio zantedeschiae TaxID=1237077 RepID=A0ABQ3B0R4_9GAMM|nr:LysR family transcriptional regulator [Cellvibrio zantedeschiae]GGY73906.1 LysR family transcriptional regulator [Cellvibrio zantedeschiae]